MQVGHTVEVYQVVFAIVDDGYDVVPVSGRQTAEQVLYLRMFLQIGDDLVGSTQIRAFVGIGSVRFEIEVAAYAVTGGGIVHHFVIQFQVAGSGPYQNHIAEIAPPAAVKFYQTADDQTESTDYQEAQADVGQVEIRIYLYVFQYGKGQSRNDGEIKGIAEYLHDNLVGVHFTQVQDDAVPAGYQQVTETDDELQGPGRYRRVNGRTGSAAEQVEQQVVQDEIPQFHTEDNDIVVTVGSRFHNKMIIIIILMRKTGGKSRSFLPFRVRFAATCPSGGTDRRVRNYDTLTVQNYEKNSKTQNRESDFCFV